MTADVPPAPVSTKMLWTGRVLSALPALLLLVSGAFKFVMPEGFEKIGYPASVAIPLGIVEMSCAIIYLIPQTSVLGAILITGYMGGAIATHVRLGEGWYAQFLIGVVVWLGLYLREARLRALIPLRS